MKTYDAFWLPGMDVPTRVVTAQRGDRSVQVRFPVLAVTDVERAISSLRQRRAEVLARRTVDDIIDTLDRVAEYWLADTEMRRDAIEAISILSGFSEGMVSHAIHLEQVSSRAGDMRLALDRELGSRSALDGFIKTPKGRSTAVGPEIVGGIFSANIPALPHVKVLGSPGWL